jgi:hypothetical protein
MTTILVAWLKDLANGLLDIVVCERRACDIGRGSKQTGGTVSVVTQWLNKH